MVVKVVGSQGGTDADKLVLRHARYEQRAAVAAYSQLAYALREDSLAFDNASHGYHTYKDPALSCFSTFNVAHSAHGTVNATHAVFSRRFV